MKLIHAIASDLGFSEREIELVSKRFDVIGDIVVLKVSDELSEERQLALANELLRRLGYVKVILKQASPIAGVYRTRELAWLAGEKRTTTIHKEHGCRFKVDLVKMYFSPRLSYERLRVAKQVRGGEVVVNMFAGVGCYSIIAARLGKPKVVYSIDINPDACELMKENVLLNEVSGIVVPILGDARQVIESRLKQVADRVLMPLPERAIEFIDCALLALKPSGGWLHYYDFVHARKDEDPVQKVSEKFQQEMFELGVQHEVAFGRIVRPVGPAWYQIALDVKILATSTRP